MTRPVFQGRPFPAVLLFLILALCATQAQAQLLGHNTPGDYGLLSGSQAPPGVYLIAPLYVRYDSDTLRNGLGNRLPTETEVAVNAYVFGVTWVSKTKVLGANYSLQAYVPFMNNALEAPILGLGMWTFELFGGGTFFFDEARSWHVATTAFLRDAHGERGLRCAGR